MENYLELKEAIILSKYVNLETHRAYNKDNGTFNYSVIKSKWDTKGYIPAPTYYEVDEWLENKVKIGISVYLTKTDTWSYKIHDLKQHRCFIFAEEYFLTKLEALKNAINYFLNNCQSFLINS